MKPILELRNIGKKFNIRSRQQPYLSLRESFFSFLQPSSKTESFWALQNISFDVMPGDTVGIIGKNGAGKSTLLKILSKITPPSTGKVTCRGRIASLLEVGTGFHPELSGRENIFLNGSILGMKRQEIKRQLDAIVDFSGVEQFLETPLKHYSSGMQLRLAFAVAAFLEPEILVIDEVLAVGDAEFQKKCLGKMEDVSKSGRTILFVSHSVNALKSLCQRGIYLKNGEMSCDADLSTALNQYLNLGDQINAHFSKNSSDRSKDCEFTEIRVCDDSGQLKDVFLPTEAVHVELFWENKKGLPVTPNIELHNLAGKKIFWTTDSIIDKDGTAKMEIGRYKSTAVIPANWLNNGDYVLHAGLDLASPRINYDCVLNQVYFSVQDSYDEPNPARGKFTFSNEEYALLPLLKWKFEKHVQG